MKFRSRVVLTLVALLTSVSALATVVIMSTGQPDADIEVSTLLVDDTSERNIAIDQDEAGEEAVESRGGLPTAQVAPSPTVVRAPVHAQVSPPAITPPCDPNGQTGEPCEPRDVSHLRLFSGGVSGAAYAPHDVSSVEEALEKGLREAEASPVHVVFRGTLRPDSVRCDWRGVARTAEQREEAIRFWLELDESTPLPSAEEVERRLLAELDRIDATFQWTARAGFRSLARGGSSTDQIFLTCYVDYNALEYLVSDGPSVVTVAYDQIAEARSYELYREAYAGGEFSHISPTAPIMTEGQYQAWLDDAVWLAERSMRNVVHGRESVVFLSPMAAHNAISVEAWQAVAQWDLRRAVGPGTDEASRVEPKGGPPPESTEKPLQPS